MAKAQRIVTPIPPVGAQCHFINSKGLFVLSEQPGNLFHITCTHAGSGSLVAYDGAVDELGNWIGDPKPLISLIPAAMGVWHLNGGFHRGLVIDTGSQNQNHLNTHTNTAATIVWHTKKSQPDSWQPFNITKSGTYLITDENALLYEVLINTGGSGSIKLDNGLGQTIWHMPSMFAGSFLLEHVFCWKGLTVTVDAPIAVSITISYKIVKDK